MPPKTHKDTCVCMHTHACTHPCADSCAPALHAHTPFGVEPAAVSHPSGQPHAVLRPQHARPRGLPRGVDPTDPHGSRAVCAPRHRASPPRLCPGQRPGSVSGSAVQIQLRVQAERGESRPSRCPLRPRNEELVIADGQTITTESPNPPDGLAGWMSPDRPRVYTRPLRSHPRRLPSGAQVPGPALTPPPDNAASAVTSGSR